MHSSLQLPANGARTQSGMWLLHTKGVGEYDPTSRVQGRVQRWAEPQKKHWDKSPDSHWAWVHSPWWRSSSPVGSSCRKAKGLKDSQVLEKLRIIFAWEKWESLSFFLSSWPGMSATVGLYLSINLIDFVTLTGLNSGLRNSSFWYVCGVLSRTFV